ncbi:trypsin-like serine protease [Moritella sp. F3]|uniref:S1 family peptidase n=1 Tax=Moritella sp. F3 TaxID=2718882 RepID=UPI0018E1C3EE|nr:serine protease [Moritella sp. F3]GIC76277.1 serine protease [Moritella sp. F1]GIC82935.1 serine protease [Moritella sp. F3]
MHFKRILSFLFLAPLSLSQLHASEEMSQRIISGTKSDSDSWPFMVALVSKNRDVYNGQFCGASFIGERYILTAAHCVEGKEGQDLDAVIGISDLVQVDAVQHRYSVKEVYVHEGYVDVSTGNDIAILELENDVNYTAVNLADQYLRNNLSAGELLTVMGWGDQDPSRDYTQFKSELYQVTVPLVEQSLCPNIIRSEDNAFCAGFVSGGYDSCQGDSGGPIVVASAGGFEQLGIVSWGEGCAEAGNYGVYANVSHFTDWIAGKTQGLSFHQLEFVGAKTAGLYTHTFSIRNTTGQSIHTSGAVINGSSGVITANSCAELRSNESCAVTILYTVGTLDFEKVSVSLSTDHPQISSVALALSYIGTEVAGVSVSNVVRIANTNVYSSPNAWIGNSNTLQSPLLNDNEFAQMTISGLAVGSLSFDMNVSTEKNYDYLNVYTNGSLYTRFSGIESRSVGINLPRHSNTVVLEYKKDRGVAHGGDRVIISNLTHSVTGQSVRPDGNAVERSSSGSGGAINWVYLLPLGLLTLVRRRFI